MKILGLSAFYHDSAAALVVDGEIVAAAQEERFTRKKHDSGFPANATRYCLDSAGITPDELDHIAFYDKPFLKFERLLETWLAPLMNSLASRFSRVNFFMTKPGTPTLLSPRNNVPTGPVTSMR